MTDAQYLCWNCGLMNGAEDSPMEPSQLCLACRAAAAASKQGETR